MAQKIILTKVQILDIIVSANYDLFSDRRWAPNGKDLKRWLNQFLKKNPIERPKRKLK